MADRPRATRSRATDASRAENQAAGLAAAVGPTVAAVLQMHRVLHAPADVAAGDGVAGLVRALGDLEPLTAVLNIYSSIGSPVTSRSLPRSTPLSEATATWDGKGADGVCMNPGTYRLRFTATNAAGQTINSDIVSVRLHY